MGVSATGKTAVGVPLAEELGCEFVEGDDLHPRSNIEKMTKGTALTDEDRWPWLRAVAERVAAEDAAGTSTVVTCSALKRSYRDVLRS
ncbi:MAG TPA: gluconokinase, GntK/IdnK-type, partial [Actinomycetales bacterium]